MKILSIITLLFILIGHSQLLSQENTTILCADGIDNDGDGNIDCEDSECFNLSNGACQICSNDGLSFADIVLSYNPQCTDVTSIINQDSSLALGIPDYSGAGDEDLVVSLGDGGSIILGFTNNFIGNSGDLSPDI